VVDILRAYQIDAVADLEHAITAGERRIILVAPTASGKTVIAAELIRYLAERLPSVLVLSHRLEIIKQTSRKLYANGIPHGIIKAGFSPRPLERVQRSHRCKRCGRGQCAPKRSRCRPPN
jgi:superfamily II DNA or RNA helicase